MSARCARADTTMAQEGVYDRPFITNAGATSLGGYLEGNTNRFVEDGVSDGLSMELRRFNVFLFSSISARVRFLAELEFEHGTEEIALETALVDVRIRPSLVLRAGILLPPIGYLNQNHDSPRWDFVERALVTTAIVSSTLSETGGGAYLTNGLGDGIVEKSKSSPSTMLSAVVAPCPREWAMAWRAGPRQPRTGGTCGGADCPA